MNKLKLHPQDDGPVIVIDGPLVRVGRDDASDVCLPDASVSRHHAEIECRGGEWFIFDLNSSNGIRINGLPVPNARLQSGQVLQIGRVDFHVEVDTPGDNATMVLDRSPVFEEGPGATMITPPPVPPRATPRGVQREAPKSKASDAMTTLTAIAVSVAVVLGAIEIYNIYSERTAMAPVDPAPAPVEAAAPAASAPAAAVAPPGTGTSAAEPAPAPGRGTILVSTDLPATVSIDGQKGVRLEASGLKRFEVAPGDHVVRFRADGWRAQVEARVRAGEQTLVKPDDDPRLVKPATTPR